jgi:hypothetical protein
MHLTFAKRVCECPVCESSAVRRSTRKGFVERTWFRLAFVWPYRCDDCDSRFWGFYRSYEITENSLVEGLSSFLAQLSFRVLLKPSLQPVPVRSEESRVHSYRKP